MTPCTCRVPNGERSARFEPGQAFHMTFWRPLDARYQFDGRVIGPTAISCHWLWRTLQWTVFNSASIRESIVGKQSSSPSDPGTVLEFRLAAGDAAAFREGTASRPEHRRRLSHDADGLDEERLGCAQHRSARIAGPDRDSGRGAAADASRRTFKISVAGRIAFKMPSKQLERQVRNLVAELTPGTSYG